MSTEKYANNATTSLSAAITSTTATSITITSATLFPSSPQFRILIDSEIMLVTGISGTTWTVTRGIEGSTAATHTTGSTVSLILTAGALDQITADNCQSGSISSLPAVEKAGRLYFPTDSPVILRDTGAIWQPYGPIWNLSPPNLSGYTQFNALTGDTVTQQNSQSPVVFYQKTHGTNWNWSGYYKATPATPFDIRIAMSAVCQGTNFTVAGLFLSDGTKYLTYYISSNGTIHGSQLNTTTSWNVDFGTAYNWLTSPLTWIRVTDDGTTRNWYLSDNAESWMQVATESHTNWLTPTRYGFGSSNWSGFDAMVTIYHLSP